MAVAVLGSLLAMSASAQAPSTGSGQGDAAAELAKKLANPVAALISVPLQYNNDGNYGADDKGSKSTLLIQPVIPFSLGEDWNLMSMTGRTRSGGCP